MAKRESKVCFACMVRKKRGEVSIEIPDFQVTIKGANYVDAWAKSIETLTALYSYSVERNLPIRMEATFESCMDKLRKERGSHYVYMLQPTADLM